MQTLDKHTQIDSIPTGDNAQPTNLEAQNFPEKGEDTLSDKPQEVLLGLAGVRRIEAIREEVGRLLPLIFVFALIAAFVGQLNGATRGSYLGYATGAFGRHSTLSTVNVVTGVVSAIAQPIGARLADTFGRPEVYSVTLALFVVGTIIQATSSSIESYAGGSVIHSFGNAISSTCLNLLLADSSTLRWRLLAGLINNAPVLITTWVSGDVVQAVLSQTTWRWGYGMWAIIEPVATLPLLGLLFYAQWRVYRTGNLVSFRSTFQRRKLLSQIFWEFDLIGIMLIVAALVLFLYPFTVVSSTGSRSDSWKQASILVPIIIGILLFPGFFYWETKARHPIVPLKLLKDRGVWSALLISTAIGLVVRLQSNYLYTVLVVAFDESPKSATRIAQLYRFTVATTAICVGVCASYVRRLKPFILFGVVLYFVGYGLLIRFRSAGEVSGVIGAEIVLGMGGGMITFPSLVSAEARTKHDHLAMILALWTAVTLVGGSVGAAIAGGIWTNVLMDELTQRLGSAAAAAKFYANPLVEVRSHPMGSASRIAINEAYAHVQYLLCVTGICLCLLLVVGAVFLRDTRLTDEQSRKNAEEDSIDEENSKRFWLFR